MVKELELVSVGLGQLRVVAVVGVDLAGQQGEVAEAFLASAAKAHIRCLNNMYLIELFQLTDKPKAHLLSEARTIYCLNLACSLSFYNHQILILASLFNKANANQT